MIKALFKKEIFLTLRVLWIFIAVITMYGSVIVAMYDPKLGESLNMMAESMPELFAAFGMLDPGLTLLDFILNYLYGFILIVIPFLFSVIMCHRLMGHYIDRGSMAYLLTNGHSRSQVFFTQYAVLVVGIMSLIVYAVLLVLGCSTVMFEEALDLGSFLMVNLGLFCLHLFLGTMCYLSSVCFNETKYMIGVGAGAGIVFILVQMLSQVSEQIAWLKYFTPLTLFDAKGLAGYDTTAIWGIVGLCLMSFCFVGLARYVFKKRDLAL